MRERPGSVPRAAAIDLLRPGNRGRERGQGLDVRYSRRYHEVVTVHDQLAITSPERTLIDVWDRTTSPRRRERIGREAVRLGIVTVPSLWAYLGRHPGERGTGSLARTLESWRRLPFHRCRSDAEAYALTVLDAAGVEAPLVNAMVGRYEADLVWPGLRHIIEIDGRTYHPFSDMDAEKTAHWHGLGYRVERVQATSLFDDGRSLLLVAPPPTR